MRKTLLPLLLLSALSCSLGWGIRGDYGHEAGAMIPGALLALAVCLTAGREDWLRRASLLAMIGAIGWAFGGQMSYGQVIGYTAHSSFPDALYGYGSLFVIGALWGGIGAGVLALGLTRPRSELERFALPLSAIYLTWLLLDLTELMERLVARWDLYDSDWVQATSALLVAAAIAAIAPRFRHACKLIALIAAGWWIGFGLLTVILGLRMTPPRSDNWAGCVGIAFALWIRLWRTRNRAAMMLMLYAMLAGGIGFAVGDFVQMIGRAQWGPIGRFASLQNLDYWKWMELLFGLIMGFGVAIGLSRIVRSNLAPPDDDEPEGPMRYVSLFFLFVIMPWENIVKNVRDWAKSGVIAEGLLNLSPQLWFLIAGLLLTGVIVYAIVRYRKDGLALAPANAFGRAQMLFLLIMWIFTVADFTQKLPAIKSKGVLSVQAKFWLIATACTLIVLWLRGETAAETDRLTAAGDDAWLPGWKHWAMWVLIPLLLFALAGLSVGMHGDPLPGSNLRFGAGQ